MKARVKATGEIIEVKEGTQIIFKDGSIGLGFRTDNGEILNDYQLDFKDVTQEESNDGKALLYAVEKTAERTKREMIEKAKKYLQEKLYTTPIFEHDEDEEPIMYVCVPCCDSVEEFISNFKQAMEE